MGNLLKNERLKQYKKVSTWILIGVILAFSLLTLGITKFSYYQMSRYSYGMDWEDRYTQEIQNSQRELNNNAQEDPQYQNSLRYDIEKFTYLSENRIEPSDWRVDVVTAYYAALTNIADLELKEGGPDPMIAQYQAQADVFKSILDKNDWRELVRQKMKLLEEGENSGLISILLNYQLPETGEERQVAREVLQMQLDYGVKPLSTSLQYYYGYNSRQTPEDAWKNNNLTKIQNNRLSLLRGENTDGRVLSSQSRATLQQDINVYVEQLRTNAEPVASDSFMGLLDSSASSLSLISIILMVMAGGMIAGEFSSGTVKLLLITPHKRREIFWAKALLLLEITLIALGAMFVVSFLFCGVLYGFQGIASMQVLSLFGSVVRIPYLLFVLMKYLLNLLPILVFGALAYMLSAVTRKGAVAIAVSILLMFGGSMFTAILSSLNSIVVPGAKFLFFCNTDLSIYLPTPSAVSMMGMMTGSSVRTVDPSMTLPFSVIVLLVYLVCFLWIARDSFCRRDVK